MLAEEDVHGAELTRAARLEEGAEGLVFHKAQHGGILLPGGNAQATTAMARHAGPTGVEDEQGGEGRGDPRPRDSINLKSKVPFLTPS